MENAHLRLGLLEHTVRITGKGLDPHSSAC